jgi:hypothetical protein
VKTIRYFAPYQESATVKKANYAASLQAMRLQNILKAIEILELFLEMIKTRLEYLAREKTIPEEMKTPMLSIAFASTRLTDIPELAGIRKSFEARFGREVFADVIKGDPDPSSRVQANLLEYLSVEPPNVPDKVDAAMDIMAKLGTQGKDPEDLRDELTRVRTNDITFPVRCARKTHAHQTLHIVSQSHRIALSQRSKQHLVAIQTCNLLRLVNSCRRQQECSRRGLGPATLLLGREVGKFLADGSHLPFPHQ